MSKSNYLEKKALDHALGVATFAAPANQFLALHTASAGEDGSGAELSSAASGQCAGYARACICFNATCLGTGQAQGPTANIEFTNSSTTTAWPQICYFGIWDCSSTTANACGNLLYYGTLTEGKTIAAGDTLRFTTNSICITEN